jgi:DNA polymerase-3 subunit epsilon
MCEEDGIPIADAIELFVIAAENADLVVCHNTAFDTKLMAIEYLRLQPDRAQRLSLAARPSLCTMKVSTPICRIGKKDGRTGYKWPKLEEAIQFFFNEELENAHSAIVDIKATRRLFYKLGELGYLDEESR